MDLKNRKKRLKANGDIKNKKSDLRIGSGSNKERRYSMGIEKEEREINKKEERSTKEMEVFKEIVRENGIEKGEEQELQKFAKENFNIKLEIEVKTRKVSYEFFPILTEKDFINVQILKGLIEKYSKGEIRGVIESNSNESKNGVEIKEKQSQRENQKGSEKQLDVQGIRESSVMNNSLTRNLEGFLAKELEISDEYSRIELPMNNFSMSAETEEDIGLLKVLSKFIEYTRENKDVKIEIYIHGLTKTKNAIPLSEILTITSISESNKIYNIMSEKYEKIYNYYTTTKAVITGILIGYRKITTDGKIEKEDVVINNMYKNGDLKSNKYTPFINKLFNIPLNPYIKTWWKEKMEVTSYNFISKALQNRFINIYNKAMKLSENLPINIEGLNRDKNYKINVETIKFTKCLKNKFEFLQCNVNHICFTFVFQNSYLLQEYLIDFQVNIKDFVRINQQHCYYINNLQITKYFKLVKEVEHIKTLAPNKQKYKENYFILTTVYYDDIPVACSAYTTYPTNVSFTFFGKTCLTELLKELCITKFSGYYIYSFSVERDAKYILKNHYNNYTYTNIKINDNDAITKFTLNFGSSYYLSFIELSKIFSDPLEKLADKFGFNNQLIEFPIDFITSLETLEYYSIYPEKKYWKNYNKSLKDTKWSLKKNATLHVENNAKVIHNFVSLCFSYLATEYSINPHKYNSFASLSFAIFRTNYYNVNNNSSISLLHPTVDKILRPYYITGEANIYKYNGTDLYHYDLNSAYPYSMLQVLPIGTPKCEILPTLKELTNVDFKNNSKNLDISNIFGFISCNVTCPSSLNIPSLPALDPITSKVIYPTGTFNGIYFSEELKYAQSIGYIINFVYFILHFEKSTESPFKSFVNHFYKIKSAPNNITNDSYNNHNIITSDIISPSYNNNNIIKSDILNRSSTELDNNISTTNKKNKKSRKSKKIKISSSSNPNNYLSLSTSNSTTSTSHSFTISTHVISKFFAKMFLNSLSGRIGMKQKFPKILADNLNRSILNTMNLTTTPNLLFEINNSTCLYSYFSKQSTQYDVLSNVAIASAITSYTRIQLHPFKILEGNQCYYSDTDSLFLQKPLDPKFVSDKLGQFKLVNRLKSAVFLKIKCYSVILENNLTKNTTSGIKEHISRNLRHQYFLSYLFPLLSSLSIPKTSNPSTLTLTTDQQLSTDLSVDPSFIKNSSELSLTFPPTSNSNRIIATVDSSELSLTFPPTSNSNRIFATVDPSFIKNSSELSLTFHPTSNSNRIIATDPITGHLISIPYQFNLPIPNDLTTTIPDT